MRRGARNRAVSSGAAPDESTSDPRFWDERDEQETSSWLGALGGEAQDDLDAIARPTRMPDVDWDAEAGGDDLAPPEGVTPTAPTGGHFAPEPAPAAADDAFAAAPVAEVPVAEVPIDAPPAENVGADAPPPADGATGAPARRSPFMEVVPTAPEPEPEAVVAPPPDAEAAPMAPVYDLWEPAAEEPAGEESPRPDAPAVPALELVTADEPIEPTPPFVEMIEPEPDPLPAVRPSAFATLQEIAPVAGAPPAVEDDDELAAPGSDMGDGASLDWLVAAGDDLLPRR